MNKKLIKYGILALMTAVITFTTNMTFVEAKGQEVDEIVTTAIENQNEKKKSLDDLKEELAVYTDDEISDTVKELSNKKDITDDEAEVLMAAVDLQRDKGKLIISNALSKVNKIFSIGIFLIAMILFLDVGYHDPYAV